MKCLITQKTVRFATISIVCCLWLLEGVMGNEPENTNKRNCEYSFKIGNNPLIDYANRQSTILFEENWTSGNFTNNNWTFDPSVGNWHINNTQGNPKPSAQFSWSPPQTNYSFSLISRNIEVASSQNDILLSFDLLYDEWLSTGDEHMRIFVYDQSDWQPVATFSNNGDIPWTTYTYNITSIAQGKTIKLKFEATGAATIDIDFWRIDNIKIIETEVVSVPEITIAPDSLFHYIPFSGATAGWYVNVKNTGQAELTFNIHTSYSIQNKTNAYKSDWIVLPQQTSYNLHSDSSLNLYFEIQSQQLLHGIHHAAIVFESNDPHHSLITIPASVDVGTLTVNDNSYTQISIYSPPSSGILYLFGGKPLRKITARNMMGQVVLEVSPINNQSSIDISHLKTGVYIIELSLNTDQRIVIKISVTN